MMQDLAEKYSLQPIDILEALYLYGLETRRHDNEISSSSSPWFNDITKELPDRRLVDTVALSEGTDLYDTMSILRDRYFDHADTIGSSLDKYDDRLIDPKFKYVILTRSSEYNYMILKKIVSEQRVELWEEKSNEPFNMTMLKHVLDHSSNDNHRIDAIGNVVLGTVFDGSHIYDMGLFDQIYGECAFTDAMLSLLQKRITSGVENGMNTTNI